jgi:hypothetical protein
MARPRPPFDIPSPSTLHFPSIEVTTGPLHWLGSVRSLQKALPQAPSPSPSKVATALSLTVPFRPLPHHYLKCDVSPGTVSGRGMGGAL